VGDLSELPKLLLGLSDSQLDPLMHPYIEKWSSPPKPIEVLEVLDYCVHGGLASGFVMQTLQSLYEIRCKEENTTHEQVAKSAKWRDTL